MKPSPARLSVQPPRCRLDLALADPHGRGREQTRVGGAGAEAEGRAQREEAAEPRSQAGRCHSASPPPAAARGGVGEAQPSGEGGDPAGLGRVYATRDPGERVPELARSPSHALWRSGLCGADRGPDPVGREERWSVALGNASWRGGCNFQVYLGKLCKQSQTIPSLGACVQTHPLRTQDSFQWISKAF